MKQLYPMKGIVPVLNTPFTADDSVDIKALKRNTELSILAGIAGLLVPAMASEVYKLTANERHRIVEAVLQQVDGRIPVIGGAGETEPRKRTMIIKDLLDIGCENVLLQIPYKDDEQFYSEFCRAANLGPKMIMLQDWDFDGHGLRVDLVCRLFEEVPAFRCFKIEVVPAGVKYSEMLNATQGRLNISGGWAVMQMIEALDRGVHAFMTTAMNEIYVRIYNLYTAGKRERAKVIFNELLPVLAFSNQHLDISIHFFKRLLYKQGVYPTPNVRPPITSFDEIHCKTADDLIEKIIQMTSAIKGEISE
jgi:dihydrodipicolinate synthase/N-acetylneuraminate lyase